MWHKDFIPICSFIAWLVCKDIIKGYIFQWGVILDATCVLSGNSSECKDHLFFQCDYSRFVWDAVQKRCNYQYKSGSWAEEVEDARIGLEETVAFNVTIYYVWYERNTIGYFICLWSK